MSLAELRWTEAAVTEARLAAGELSAETPLEGTADRAVAPFGTPAEVIDIEDGGEAVERRVAAALLDVLARDAAVVDAMSCLFGIVKGRYLGIFQRFKSKRTL